MLPPSSICCYYQKLVNVLSNLIAFLICTLVAVFVRVTYLFYFYFIFCFESWQCSEIKSWLFSGALDIQSGPLSCKSCVALCHQHGYHTVLLVVFAFAWLWWSRDWNIGMGLGSQGAVPLGSHLDIWQRAREECEEADWHDRHRALPQNFLFFLCMYGVR